MHKSIILGLVLLAVVLGGYFIFSSETVDKADDARDMVEDGSVDDEIVMRKARDAAYGFEFSYRERPDGYVTLEDTESTHEDFVTGIILFNEKEYTEFSESTDAREGPPAMHVRVYKNPERLHASVWSMRNPGETNVGLAMDGTDEVVVGGANAEHFIADGLYPIDTYVVANGDHLYVLMGAYRERNDQMHRDFKALVGSFTFIPTTATETEGTVGKLNIRAVCEDALIYMTFPSGEEANAFVEACVAGEHPEVIERYKEEQGLDGAVI